MNLWNQLGGREVDKPPTVRPARTNGRKRGPDASCLSNPWHLTRLERGVMESLIETGCNLRSAEQLELSRHTVNEYARNIVKKMAMENRTLAVLAYDRWMRETQGACNAFP